jgi:integrase
MKITPGKFKEYLDLTYPNKNTRRQYLLREKYFISNFAPDMILDQHSLNEYTKNVIEREKPNPFYNGFIKAYLTCYDPEHKEVKYMLNKSKSREYEKLETSYKFTSMSFLEKIWKAAYESWKIDKQQNHHTVNRDKKLMCSLMVQIYAETGLRFFELNNLTNRDKIHTNYGWKLYPDGSQDSYLIGIGKNRKEFKVTISPKTAKKMQAWIEEFAIDPHHPFYFYHRDPKSKKTRVVSHNQHMYFYRLMKKYGITPHAIRHTVGHHLATHGMDIDEIKKVLRHKSIATTQIYTNRSMEDVEKKKKALLFPQEQPKDSSQKLPQDT